MGDKSHRLPPAAFGKKFVVAAIHRGKSMVTYQVESVVADGGNLVLHRGELSGSCKQFIFSSAPPGSFCRHEDRVSLAVGMRHNLG